MSKSYEDKRWHDNPGLVPSLCNQCKNWNGRGKCKKYAPKIPDKIMDKSYLGTEQFDENYCLYRE